MFSDSWPFFRASEFMNFLWYVSRMSKELLKGQLCVTIIGVYGPNENALPRKDNHQLFVSDEAPNLWSALAFVGESRLLLGEINASFTVGFQTTKHFTTLREILHMVDRTGSIEVVWHEFFKYSSHDSSRLDVDAKFIFQSSRYAVPAEPIYPEYIPLEDEHEFPVEEQSLPPVDSPTAESPGYVTESDPEEDLEEYEDDETEDGQVDYPMDGEDDGDDDDDDSSGDDADGEDEDDEDEEEEEHLAPPDSAIVIPVDESVFPPKGTDPVIPPPSTDITIGARITVRPHTSISLPLEAEVERLLAMTTPSPSPPISLSPPSTGERLVRSMAPPAHLSPPPMPSPLLPSSGCPTQIQTLRIASTQALIDAVTAALPSPPLPPLPPSLYIPPPVDRRDDIPESEQPPRKRLYLSTLGFRYKVGESSTARPTRGREIDYGFVSTVDAEEREVNTRVTELAELHEHDTHDLYALLEDASG
ncbi:hypothetical protein Tco_1383380 [Tanacetum coccineum]